MNTKNQRGFTIVELAVVITIVGILIAGILKGQEMIVNSRISATIAQVNAFSAAYLSFQDVYRAIPGDLADAATKIPGCNANCSPYVSLTGAGNGQISDGDFITSQGYVRSPMPNPPTDVFDENMLFWIHLLKAGLITGMSDNAINGPQLAAFGVTYPESKLGGGFVAGSQNVVDRRAPGMPNVRLPWRGEIIVLVPKAVDFTMSTFASPGLNTQTIYPSYAHRIDEKIDDGNPLKGQVLSYGITQRCVVDQGGYVYNDTFASNECNMIFKLRR